LPSHPTATGFSSRRPRAGRDCGRFHSDSSTGRLVGEPHPITSGSTGEVDFDAQADGSKVAYRAVRAGRNELWERSVDGGRERLLLSSPDWKLVKPRWSPDGAKLAFLRCGTEGGPPVLALLNTDGSGERALTKPEELEMLASDWSNSGESILGSCRFGPSDRYSTCVLPVSGNASPGRVRVIASDPKRNLFNQRFSPDQRWITFLAHDLRYNSTSTVYVIPAAGGAWRAMTDGAAFDDKPRWGPDGRVLYCVSNRDGVKNVWGRRFDNTNGTTIGEPFPVTSFRSPQFLISPQAVQMDIAVTATHLLVPMSESRGDVWMLDHVDR
jgi:Tol biopolymer transport system component